MSWLPSSKLVCVQGLFALELDNHRQHSWVVRFLSSACEVLLQTGLCVETTIWSVSVGIPSKKMKNIIVTSKKNTFLPFMCKRVKTWCSLELWTRGFDTMVENPWAVKEVHAANLGAPKFVLDEMLWSVHLGIYLRRIKNYHGDRRKELAPTK